jgi:hypothetical protein
LNAGENGKSLIGDLLLKDVDYRGKQLMDFSLLKTTLS